MMKREWLCQLVEDSRGAIVATVSQRDIGLRSWDKQDIQQSFPTMPEALAWITEHIHAR